MANKPVILGFMGNRGFFPTEFTVDGSAATKSAVEHILGDAVTYIDLGNIETYADAKAAAAQDSSTSSIQTIMAASVLFAPCTTLATKMGFVTFCVWPI